MLGKLLSKVAILAMVMILVLGGQVVWGAEVQLTDVPENHWAYQGVKKLVQEGYLAVFEDGTFQGQRPVDRYTLASVVGTMLVEIEKGQLGVTQADLELLRKLSTEFRDELVRWYNESENLGATVADTQKRVQVMDDTITRVIDTMEQEDAATRQSMQEQAAFILAEVARTRDQLAATDAALLEEVGNQGGRLQAAEDELATQGAAIKATEIALAETNTAVEGNPAIIKEHTRWLAVQGESLNALEDAVGVKVQSRFAEREAALSLLQSGLEAKDAELETELKRVETDLAEATQQMGDIELKLVAWQEASTQRDDDLEIRVEGLEMGVGQLSQALRAETEGRQGEVDSLAQDVEEMQGLLAKQAEALAAADGQLMKDVTTLRQDLVRSLEAVQVDLVNISDKIAALDKRTAILQQGTAADSKDLADLKGYVNGLQGELVTLNDRLVVTEEKLAKMDEQVTTQSSSQLSASLMREKRLERQLQELQEEFDSYRKQADKDNKSLKGASNIATIAAVIALIVAVVVNN